jgi:RecA-family ATPase
MSEAWDEIGPPALSDAEIEAMEAVAASVEDDGAAEPDAAKLAVLVDLSTVEPKPVRWIWRGYIAIGAVTLIDGDPGTGKTTVVFDIAARVSSGRAMPDGSYGDVEGPAGVVILSAEDDDAHTIAPRLREAGADLAPGRIVRLAAVRHVSEAKGEQRETQRMPSLLDVDAVREAIIQSGAALVTIDPLMAYLPGDAHRDNEVRQALAPLSALAAERGVAVVVVRHLNKSGGTNAIQRGGGSIGIIVAARTGLLVA